MTLDYSKLPEFWQWVLLIGAILSALAILYGFGRRLWKALGVIIRLTAAAPALMDLPQFMITTAHTLADQDATLTGHGEKLERIDHEIHENGGKTLKDGVVATRKQLVANTRRLTRIETGVAGLYTRVDANEKAATQDRADIAAARQELEDTRPARTTNPKEKS